MIEFLRQHKSVLVIGLIAFLGAVLFAVWLIFNQEEQTPPVVTPAQPEFLNDYQFLSSEQSEEDKRLMLLGVIYAESYLTFELGDFSGLINLESQSTNTFKPEVTRKIAYYQNNPTETVIATVDSASIVINRPSEVEARLTMTTQIQDAAGVSKNNSVLVQLYKSGDYWLVNNILVQ